MGDKTMKLLFEKYLNDTEDTKATDELYERLCCTDSETSNDYSSELIETAVYEERENAFYAGFRAALNAVLDLFKKIDDYENEAR